MLAATVLAVRSMRRHEPWGLSVDWTDSLTAYTLWLMSAGAASGTIKIRTSYIRRLAVGRPNPWQIDQSELIGFMAHDGWAPETRKAARSAIRSFYRWAVIAGQVEHSPAEMLPSVKVAQGKPRPAPDSALSGALARATPNQVLMVMLAANAGLRRSEIAAVHTRDVEHSHDGVSLRVRGKGGRVRVVPLMPLLVAALEVLPPGYVFPGKFHGHLSPDWVGRQMSAILGPGWTAHTLRHRFASLAFATERDILAVKELLGHASVATTQIYTAVPDHALRNAVMGTGGAA